jgi:hypothetical protein
MIQLKTENFDKQEKERTFNLISDPRAVNSIFFSHPFPERLNSFAQISPGVTAPIIQEGTMSNSFFVQTRGTFG